jgi:hypothetical protein
MPIIFGSMERVEPGEVVGGVTVGPAGPIEALYVVSGGTIIRCVIGERYVDAGRIKGGSR